ncbi:MAG TPA: SAF domain-containing protein [Candidatus Dormibacteraeota bacterium]|nr:SAF domain-containing protein [Candidatus Dormibacteraeota bacterium]
MRRRTLVGLLLTLVVFAVIGLLYLQAVAQSQATRAAWMVTRDVPAGTVLDAGNVKLVHLPSLGDQFSTLDQAPAGRRAAHRLSAQTLITRDDLMSADAVQVPITVKVAPGVGAGDTLDLYAVVGARTVLVGRRLVVVAPGNPMTVLVPAADEPYWVTLEANNVALFAAKSAGVGVPPSPSVSVNDAISNLSGSAQAGSVLVGTAPPTSTPVRPTPSPTAR